jgi:glutathione S-transferase
MSLCCALCYVTARKDVMFEKDPQRKIQGRTTLEAMFRMYYAKFCNILENSGGDFVIGKKLTHADFWLANFVSIWDEPLV